MRARHPSVFEAPPEDKLIRVAASSPEDLGMVKAYDNAFPEDRVIPSTVSAGPSS